MTDLIVDVGSARLATTDVRPGADPVATIVALHPGVGDRRAWQWCVPVWVQADARVVTYDRRGFGKSQWNETIHDHVADLLAVLDDRAADRVVLVGNSTGGRTAIDFALAHPDRVRALVLVASAISGQPQPPPEQTTGSELRLDEELETAEQADDLDLVNRLELRYWLDGTEQPDGRVPGAARNLFLDMNGRALAAPAVGETVPSPDAWTRLHEITAPTLIVTGRHDLRSLIAAGRHLHAGIRDSRLVEMEDSAHLPSLDDPERFAALVVDFVASLGG